MSIIAQDNAVYNSESKMPVSEQWQFSQYLRGMTIYDERRPLCDCLTAAQRRGWLTANRAEAEMETGLYQEKI